MVMAISTSVPLRKNRAWLVASLQPATLICLLMITAVWAILNISLINEQQRALDAAIHKGSTLVRLFEENTTSMLRGIDRTLLILRQEYKSGPTHHDLRDFTEPSGSPEQLAIGWATVAPNGEATSLSKSHGSLAAAFVGERDWFLQQRNAEKDELVISAPILGRLSNRWSLVLSRRINKSDERFAGVIAASVDPNFIERFYQIVDIGKGGSIILRSLDGTILAAGGSTSRATDQQVFQPAIRDALAKSTTGYFWSGGIEDGVNRIISYRKSSDLPIIMTVAFTENDIYAGYQRIRLNYIVYAVILTLFLTLGAFFGIYHQRRFIAIVSAQERAETNVQRAKLFLDTVIENIPLPIVVKNPITLQFQLVNRAYESFMGMSRENLIGKTAFEIYAPEDAESIAQIDREASKSEKRPIVSEFSLRTPTNGTRTVATTRLVVRDDNGGPRHLITVIEDITERRESDNKIFHMAHHDALTGLANRLAVSQKIEDAAARQRRWGDPFTVLLLDLDRFKYVNDTLGHPAGDILLREVATRLGTFLRETDVLARLGGDEFAIIQMGEVNQHEAATGLANRILEMFSKPFNIDGNEITIGTSIGISLAPEHGIDADVLLKTADMALYRAKYSGRNGFTFYDPEMSEAANIRHKLENDLRHAIQRNELELRYQPIINTKTGKICGAEALVRWCHPTEGIILPSLFMPLAEDTGLINKIGEWVLDTACVEAAGWPADIKLAVNLSAVQFRRSDLSDVVIYALAHSGLPPERLELEITETALIEFAADCLPALHRFKSLGIAVALDDFGTGYSSLSQLTMFPFSKIKIDKSFTQNITKRSDCAAIVSATLTLARSLDIETTAEGVETKEQYRLLRLAGVTSLQGYLFKRPCLASEIDFDAIFALSEIADAA